LTDTEAQEVVQETIISVSRHIGTFRYDPAVSSFKTWLMVVTRSRIANQYRRRKRFEAVVECPELLIEQILKASAHSCPGKGRGERLLARRLCPPWSTCDPVADLTWVYIPQGAL
jgi:RNA polymerase sigma factor (sigma-70 family)